MKVYIHNGDRKYHQLFLELGHEVVSEEESEMVVFTGGADVSPHLYNQSTHHYTYSDPDRDDSDIDCFHRNFLKLKVGICRGGQFLHVMNGGELYQDVDNHALHGKHPLVCKVSGKEWLVTSTHHQMMKPREGHNVVGVAKETTYVDCHYAGEVCRKTITEDVEVILHPRAMCFQPHPEFYAANSTRDCFKHFLDMFLESEGYVG